MSDTSTARRASALASWDTHTAVAVLVIGSIVLLAAMRKGFPVAP